MVSVGPVGRRIFVCDDELQILRALKVILRAEGYEVLTAASMEEALDALALSPVDAAIVDVVLPDGDGIELCRRLREWSDMPDHCALGPGRGGVQDPCAAGGG